MAKKKRKKPARRKLAPDLAPEHAWDRQQGETDTAWAAFIAYRDMGPARSLRKLADKLAKTRHNFDPWSVGNDWRGRVVAYDVFIDRKKREAELGEIEEMRKRHVQFSMSLQGVAALELNKIVTASRARQGIVLKASEVRDLAELGMKLERLNRGEPESIAEHRHDLTAGDVQSAMRKAVGNPELRAAIRKALETQRAKP